MLFPAVLRSAVPRAALPEVSPEERERAKRVVYGIVYGLTPYGLAQQLVEQGVTTTAAQSMIDSFLARFPGGCSSSSVKQQLCCHD
jgi:DNA polymerase-1